MDTNLEEKFPKWLVQGLGGLLIAFVALAVIDKAHTVSEDFKSSIPKNTISMSADGRVSATPDLATVNLGLLTTLPTAKAAQDENVKKVNAITDFVKKQGIDAKDITTSQLSVYPTYDYSNGKNTINGYQASQTLTIKVRHVDQSTDQLDKVVGGATEAGANQIQGVNLGFDDPDNLRQEARKQAIDKAKQKAQELADEAGLRLGRIVSISEGSVSSPYPVPYAYEAKGMGGGGGVPTPDIQTGSQDITASITVVFEVK